MRIFYIYDDVANGSQVSEQMPVIYDNLRVAVDFYDAGGSRVTPTGGMVDIEVSVDGTFWEAIPGGKFEADDTYRQTRIWPECQGILQYCRATMTDITGADNYRATIMRV